MSAPDGLRYIEPLINAYRAGATSDHVHLGLFAPDRRTPAIAVSDTSANPLAAAQDAMVAAHLAHLQPANGQAVLDVGCGIGGTLRLLNAALARARLVGLNIDQRQLAVAAEIAPQNDNTLEWRLGDASAPADEEGAFDRVLSIEAMFHFPSAARFLAGARRRLRPGGRMATSTILLAPDDALPAALRRSKSVVVDGFAPWPEPALDEARLQALAEAAGFALAAKDDLTSAVGPTFDFIAPRVPETVTRSATIELARLHRAGAMRYPLFVFGRAA